jgi:hypothetical protein
MAPPAASGEDIGILLTSRLCVHRCSRPINSVSSSTATTGGSGSTFHGSPATTSSVMSSSPRSRIDITSITPAAPSAPGCTASPRTGCALGSEVSSVPGAIAPNDGERARYRVSADEPGRGSAGYPVGLVVAAGLGDDGPSSFGGAARGWTVASSTRDRISSMWRRRGTDIRRRDIRTRGSLRRGIGRSDAYPGPTCR